jgi:hypothetical protein
MFRKEFKTIKDFEIFQIPCDGEISKKNIKNFVWTNLKLKTTIKKDCIYFYNYCEVLALYQIYKTKKSYITSVIFEPLLFGLLFDNKDINIHKSCLFETENYFVLYANSSMQFVYIKDISTTKETITNFLSQQNIELHSTKFLTIKEINRLKENSKDITNLPYIKHSNTYLIYPIVASVLLLIYLNKDDVAQEVKQQLNITPTIKAIVQNEVLIDDKWYKKDDTYQGYKIQKIEKNKVVFFINSKQISVKINHETR